MQRTASKCRKTPGEIHPYTAYTGRSRMIIDMGLITTANNMMKHWGKTRKRGYAMLFFVLNRVLK